MCVSGHTLKVAVRHAAHGSIMAGLNTESEWLKIFLTDNFAILFELGSIILYNSTMHSLRDKICFTKI